MFESDNPDIYYGVATVKCNGKESKMQEVVFKPAGVEFEDVNNGKGFVPHETGAVLKGKKYLWIGETFNTEDKVTILFKANTGQAWVMDNAVRMTVPEYNRDGYDIEYHAAESERIA